MNYYKIAQLVLASSEAKQTPSRLAILQLFADSQSLLGAYDIYEKLAKKINIATIYRNLELFEQLKLIHKVASLDKYVRCEFTDETECASMDHGFLICRDCENTQEFVREHDCDAAELSAAKASGFNCETHVIEVVGQCASCK